MWTEVFVLHAVDPDQAQARIKYSIVGGSGAGLFNVDIEGNISALYKYIFVLRVL